MLWLESFPLTRPSKTLSQMLPCLRHTLRATTFAVLENQIRGQSQPELVPNPNEQEVNLEHVLPLKPESNWPAFDEDAARAYQRRMGNLVLMQQKLNSAARSASFAKKRATLTASQYKLTAEVGSQPTWDTAAITGATVTPSPSSPSWLGQSSSRFRK